MYVGIYIFLEHLIRLVQMQGKYWGLQQVLLQPCCFRLLRTLMVFGFSKNSEWIFSVDFLALSHLTSSVALYTWVHNDDGKSHISTTTAMVMGYLSLPSVIPVQFLPRVILWIRPQFTRFPKLWWVLVSLSHHCRLLVNDSLCHWLFFLYHNN